MVLRPIVLVLLLAIGTLAGCESGDDGKSLPDPRPLLDSAAGALADLESVRFQFKTTGVVPGLAVREVTGVARPGDGRYGSAEGDADVQLPTERIQYEFALDGREAALTTGDGKHTEVAVPARLTPARLLHRDRGLGLLLRRAARTRTETREEVDGVPAYRIDAVLGREAMATLLPGVHADVNVKFWVRQRGEHDLVRLWVQVPPRKKNEGAAMLELGLSEHRTPTRTS